MSATTPRKLNRAHFAFMRALAQGVDERTSWDRYLRVEGEHTDLRTVRKTIAWIRDAFAAAARREAKPGMARLILLAPRRAATPSANTSAFVPPPTLQAFAEANGLEDFSEEEQVQAYVAAYPAANPATGDRFQARNVVPPRADRRAARRERLVARQLDALRWLEDLVAQDPRPDDRVEAWLHPALAQRLIRAGLPTLDTLVAHINAAGARWWLHVSGIGRLKAARILDWLDAHEAALGARVGDHVRVARRALTPDMLAAVVPATLALVPLEKLRLPPHLDGGAGRQRADPAGCRLTASNDLQAIDAWLATKRGASPGSGLSATQRAYRKEAERLMLWAVLERGMALSSLVAADMKAYDDFLAAPPRRWCGPRHQQRWSSAWRPLEGAMSSAARRHAFTILRSLYGFLVAQGYLVGSPLATAQAPTALPSSPSPAPLPSPVPLGAHRSLTFAQWDHLRTLLALQATDEPGRRLRRAVQWLYATGLRLSELARSTCGDLVDATTMPARSPDEYVPDCRWMLRVASRTGAHRHVPVPTALVEALDAELVRCGVAGGIAGEEGRRTPLLMRFDVASGRCLPWSPSAIYKRIKAFMAQAARTLQGDDAIHLLRASTHWLRHTHGTHALQGRQGRAVLTLQAVQNNLGHARLATTTAYLPARASLQDPNATGQLSGFWDEL